MPSIGFDRTGKRRQISRLIVDRVPKGAKVVAKCSGCGSQTVKAKKPGRSRSPSSSARASARAGTSRSASRSAQDAPGTYKFGATGSYFKWPVQASGLGTRQTRCLAAKTAQDRDLQVRRSPSRCSPRWRSPRRRRRSSRRRRRCSTSRRSSRRPRRAADGSFYPGVTTCERRAAPTRRVVGGAGRGACAYVDRAGATASRRSAFYGGRSSIAFAEPQAHRLVVGRRRRLRRRGRLRTVHRGAGRARPSSAETRTRSRTGAFGAPSSSTGAGITLGARSAARRCSTPERRHDRRLCLQPGGPAGHRDPARSRRRPRRVHRQPAGRRRSSARSTAPSSSPCRSPSRSRARRSGRTR